MSIRNVCTSPKRRAEGGPFFKPLLPILHVEVKPDGKRNVSTTEHCHSVVMFACLRGPVSAIKKIRDSVRIGICRHVLQNLLKFLRSWCSVCG